MSILTKIKGAFGDKSKDHIKVEKDIIEHQTQIEIDKTLKDSFPASDPPGNY